MRASVALEHRFHRTRDGQVWTDGWSDYGFWQRYFDVFDGVRVVARVRDAERAAPEARRADGPGVSFASVPYYLGPWQFARGYRAIHDAVRNAIEPSDAVILRVPGPVSNCLDAYLRKTGRPYGAEVVGDPYEVFSPGGVRSVLRVPLRWWTPRRLRRQCAAACAVAYVTSGALQQRYPAAPNAHVTAYSSINLDDEAFVTRPRPPAASEGCHRLLLVGSLEQLYKAPDVLIGALAHEVQAGLDLELTIVGDGKYRPELESLVRQRGLQGRVRFAGRLPPGASVRAELDRADLFVLPSRTEGLPRALIEAMARGLPCIGSAVGGIPELLAQGELVPAGDTTALSAKIAELLADPQRMSELSAENLAKAREYHASVLRTRRRRFYEAVRDATLAWQRSADESNSAS